MKKIVVITLLLGIVFASLAEAGRPRGKKVERNGRPGIAAADDDNTTSKR